MHVAVCCITFRRPNGLRRLLDGLNQLTFSKNPTPGITVIVVDNDRAEPMRAILDAVRPRFRWALYYSSEGIQGVASARNRALDLVTSDTDYIAFIDDDEVPAPAWLDELLHACRVYGAPIVQGPVRPIFCAPAPRWLMQGHFLELGPYKDGTPLHYGYAGNSLIDATAIRRLGLRFDERFNCAGGEDQHFFGCAIKSGLRVVTAENAIVHEWIPAERTTLSYLLCRRFRMGNTLALLDRIEGGAGRAIRRVINACGRLCLGIVQCVLLWPQGPRGVVTGLCNIAWGAGSLTGLFGVTYQEYKRRPARGTETSQDRANTV